MSYPAIPRDASTGLLLFGAAFQGKNDGRFLLRAGLTCDVVDHSPDRLDEMAPHYPGTWRFHEADAFEYAEDALHLDHTWDVVSVDPFSNEADEVYDKLEQWATLARMMAVVGAQSDTIRRRGLPKGWVEVKRNAAWSWVVHHKKGVGGTPATQRNHRSPVGRGKKVVPEDTGRASDGIPQADVKLGFVTPVYRRHDLSRICLRQRAAAVEHLRYSGLDAQAYIVGDEDAHRATAKEWHFEFIEHGNAAPALGAKWNAGYNAARADGCTHVMAIGSDSWIDPAMLAAIPYFKDRVTSTTGLSAFKEDGTQRFDLYIRYPAGFGVGMIYPMAALTEEACDPTKAKGCDGSTWRRSLLPKGAVYFHRPEKCSYVNFTSPDVQVTPFSALQVHRRESLLERRPEHVFGDLRPIYGDELTDLIEGFYAARSFGVFMRGMTPAEKKVAAEAARMARVAARTGNAQYKHRVYPPTRKRPLGRSGQGGR